MATTTNTTLLNEEMPASDNDVPTIVGTVVFTCLVAVVAVALRIYTRWRIVHKVGVDDYFAIASLVRPARRPRSALRWGFSFSPFADPLSPPLAQLLIIGLGICLGCSTLSSLCLFSDIQTSAARLMSCYF